MNTYKVQFKNSSLNTASVSGIQAKTATEALFIGAKALGMDTDPETQTYSLCLEAIQTHNTTETALLKKALRELNATKPIGYRMTPAEYKRRLLLIAEEKKQYKREPLDIDAAAAAETDDYFASLFNTNQKDLFA